MEDDRPLSSFQLSRDASIHCVLSRQAPQSQPPIAPQNSTLQVLPLYGMLSLIIGGLWWLYAVSGDKYFGTLGLGMLTVITVVFVSFVTSFRT
jgi:hypothetical protein